MTAYAIHPQKGSEDGTAWNMVQALSKYENILLITRKNNEEAIRAYLKEKKAASPQHGKLEFAYFDYPDWLKWWKKGGRGALLYHYLWHLGVVFYIIRKKFEFNIAHHLNFHSDWMPSFLWLLGKPLVWGPVGHHPYIPKGYLKHAPRKDRLKHDMAWIVKKLFWRFSPSLWLTRRMASRIFYINSSVEKVLGRDKNKGILLPAIASRANHNHPLEKKGFTLLSVGRFVSLKGFDIAIQAFIRFLDLIPPEDRTKARLVLIGKGPQQKYLEKLIQASALATQQIKCIDWIPQQQLWDYYKTSSALLFPSHEGAGMVVPEAMSYGLPVLCFDNPGPGETTGTSAGIRIPYTNYDDSIERFALAIHQLWTNKPLLQSLARGAVKRQQLHYSWAHKASTIHHTYNVITNVSSTITKLSYHA
jgi:glycosyltransferase involved in cell wall biosynthesis